MILQGKKPKVFYRLMVNKYLVGSKVYGLQILQLGKRGIISDILDSETETTLLV